MGSAFVAEVIESFARTEARVPAELPNVIVPIAGFYGQLGNVVYQGGSTFDLCLGKDKTPYSVSVPLGADCDV